MNCDHKRNYKALGIRHGAEGLELLLYNDLGPIVLKGLPLVMLPLEEIGADMRWWGKN